MALMPPISQLLGKSRHSGESWRCLDGTDISTLFIVVLFPEILVDIRIHFSFLRNYVPWRE